MVRSTTEVTRATASYRTPAEDPTVARLVVKDNELKAEITALDRQFAEIQGGIAQQKTASATEAAAREVLADGVASIDVTDLLQQATIVEHKLRILRKAEQLNRRELDETRSRVSQRLAADRKPQYAAIVRRMREHVLALQEAARQEIAFRQQAEADDVQLDAVCRPMFFSQRVLSAWLAEAAEHYGLSA